MELVFIYTWQSGDTDARRDLATKSKDKIAGQHAYACKGLSSWFRLGKYVIKHDQANYLLGLTKEMSRKEFKDFVKFRGLSADGKEEYCIDEIVSRVNEMFPDGGYAEALLKLQTELEGYEDCYYICKSGRIPFDIEAFYADRDAYLEKCLNIVRLKVENEW